MFGLGGLDVFDIPEVAQIVTVMHTSDDSV